MRPRNRAALANLPRSPLTEESSQQSSTAIQPGNPMAMNGGARGWQSNRLLAPNQSSTCYAH